MRIFNIETQGLSVGSEDRDRAASAIENAIAEEGLTAETFAAAYDAFLAANDGKEHDKALAAAFDRIQSAGDIALTLNWHDPNGAHLMLSPA